MKLKHLFLGLLAVACFTACDDDDESTVTPNINHVRITTESATALNEDSQDSIKVNVLLGNTATETVDITFALENNEDKVLSMSDSVLTFNVGEKSKDFYVYSNNDSILSMPRVMTLKIKSFSVENMDQYGEGITITVKPNSDIPALTEAQMEMIKNYRENLGIDIARMMGKLSCKVKVIFPIDEVGEEGETVFSKTETQEFTSETILTLSENATAEKPVLKMVDNAMGLTSLFHNILNKEISINNQAGTQFPSVAEAVKYDEKNETFSMALDNIVLNEEGTPSFVGNVLDVYGDTIQGVPFIYNFSAWERQATMAEEGATVDVVVTDPETGDIMYTEPGAAMSDLITTGQSFNPNTHLISSDISEDGWDTGIWKEASSKVNFAEGTMQFSFPWDHINSSDWTLIEVTYTLHPAK